MAYSDYSKTYLRTLTSVIEELFHFAEQIRAGLKGAQGYVLPPEFVQAFYETVVFLLRAGVRATKIHNYMDKGSHEKGDALPFYSCMGREKCVMHWMNEGQLKLISMLTTGFVSGEVYGPVQAEELLAMIVTKLESNLNMYKKWGLVEMYSEYILKLVSGHKQLRIRN
jgi:hypothetical protein